MKKITLIITALFVLISLSSFVSAEITNAWTHGALVPDVKGCIQYDSSEYIMVEADVSPAVTFDKITVNGFQFTSCSDYGSSSHCTYDPQDPRLIDSDSLPPLLNIKADFGALGGDEVNVPIKVDNTAPVIKDSSFRITKNGVNVGTSSLGLNDQISIVYEVQDDCAGFSGSYFTVNGEQKGSESRTEKNILSQSITHVVKISDIAPTGGFTDIPVDVCVKASDWFEQLSLEKCLQITVDVKGPSILSLSSAGNILTNGKGTIQLSADIEDPSGVSSVSANFKELNAQDQFIIPECIESGSKKICTWKNIPVEMSESGQKNIVVRASDSYGNQAEKSFAVSVMVDKDAPIVKEFKTTTPYEGKYYLKRSNNKLTAVIEDASGVRNTNTLIDLSGLGGVTKKNADSCEKGETDYECVWNGINVNGNDADKSVVLYVSDVVGNSAAPTVLNLGMDFDNPVLIEQEAEETEILTDDSKIRVEPSYAPIDNKVIATSALKIKALVKDKTMVYAFVNLGSIINGAEPYGPDSTWTECVQEEVTEEGNIYWLCTIETTATKVVSGARDIVIYIKDSAGNEISKIETLYFETDIELAPRVEIYSNEYKMEEEGKIIGTSSLNIKAYVNSLAIPPPTITATVTFPGSLDVKKEGARTIEGDCSKIEVINDVDTTVCEWNTKNWRTDGKVSGKVPRTPGYYDLSFNFADDIGNKVNGFAHPIEVIEPKPLELMEAVVEQNLDIFPAGVPPHLKDKIVSGYPLVFVARINHPGYSNELEQATLMDDKESYADFSEVLESSGSKKWDKVKADACNFIAPEDENSTGFWECSWVENVKSARIKNVSRTVNITLHIKDAQGNLLERDVKFKIIQKKALENIKYWEVSDISLFPEVVDRQTAAILKQRVEARIDLKPQGDLDLDVLLVGADCRTNSAYLDSPIKIRSQYTNSPWLYFDLKAQKIEIDELKFNCTLNIMFKKEDYIYANPYQVNTSFEVLFYGFPLGELSGNVKDKINGAMDNALVNMGFIGTASKIIGQFVKVCQIVYSIKDLANAMANVEMVTAPLQGTPAAGVARTSHITSKITDLTSKGIFNTLYKFCQYVMCDKTLWGDSWYSKFQGEYGISVSKTQADKGTITEAKSGVGGYSLGEEYGFSQATFWPRNPSDSIILSAATGCIPGIVLNLQKVRNIECTYAICVYENAKQGLSIAPCEMEKDFGYCKFVYGQAFELVPFKSFFEWFSKGLSQIFHDPLSTLIGIRSWQCRAIEENAAHARCVFGSFAKIGVVLEALGSLERVKANLDMEIPDDVCEQAKDIVSQMNSPAASEEGNRTLPVISGTGT